MKASGKVPKVTKTVNPWVVETKQVTTAVFHEDQDTMEVMVSGPDQEFLSEGEVTLTGSEASEDEFHGYECEPLSQDSADRSRSRSRSEHRQSRSKTRGCRRKKHKTPSSSHLASGEQKGQLSP